jgi:predicted transcriptional regulator YdeE
MNRETRIETCGPLELMGVTLYGNPEKTHFCNAWEHFGKVADEASISRIGKNLYGLQIYPPWFPKKFELTYIAGIEKERGIEVPIRMITKTLPGCKYVVQEVSGGVENIDQTLRYLYKVYIPKNGFSVAMPLDFEKYCNVKDHNTHTDIIEVWVPIVEPSRA